jgi:hypothetical protein
MLGEDELSDMKSGDAWMVIWQWCQNILIHTIALLNPIFVLSTNSLSICSCKLSKKE